MLGCRNWGRLKALKNFAILEGHNAAIRYRNGVTRRILYDDTKLTVALLGACQAAEIWRRNRSGDTHLANSLNRSRMMALRVSLRFFTMARCFAASSRFPNIPKARPSR